MTVLLQQRLNGLRILVLRINDFIAASIDEGVEASIKRVMFQLLLLLYNRGQSPIAFSEINWISVQVDVGHCW
jgi:hypothetical protein